MDDIQDVSALTVGGEVTFCTRSIAPDRFGDSGVGSKSRVPGKESPWGLKRYH